MSLGLSNVTDYSYQGVGKSYEKTVCGAEYTKCAERGRAAKTERVVDEYKRKHPESAAHVDAQVNAGKKVLSQSGADQIPREEMSMDEYKSFILGLLERIPFDATRAHDKEIISISEKGWEQMKNDPDYEAWVLGYTVENRSVRNPFAGLPGVSPTLGIENFGASIEEHLGRSVPMDEPGKKTSDTEDEESWWEKRQKRRKELMEEQIKEAQNRRAAQQALAMQEYQQRTLEGRQRMAEYFDGRTSEVGASSEAKILPKLMAYEKNMMDLL